MSSALSFPPLLAMLQEHGAVSAREPLPVSSLAAYEADFSQWHFSLSEANPCVWLQSSDLECTAPEIAQSLMELVRQRGWQNETILLFADREVEGLRPHLPKILPAFVFLPARPATTLTAGGVVAYTLDILRRQMSCSALAPYEVSKPVVGSQFFGRQAEIDRVLHYPQVNYLFVGIRRIGKTSLLKEIKRRLDQHDPPGEHQIRRVYIDCTVISAEEEFLRSLVFQLEHSRVTPYLGPGQTTADYQRQVIDHYAAIHGPLTLLLDEFDRLLAHIAGDWQLFHVLRVASQAGAIRLIMAGFRRAMAASTDERSPIFNLVTPVRLGRLSQAEIAQMLLLPLQRLGITVREADAVLHRLARETAGLPNYVQYYCQILLAYVEANGQELLTEADLSLVHENDRFRNFVLSTFMSNTDSLERALVYALIAEEGDLNESVYSLNLIDGILKKRRLILKREQLDQACRNLEIAGVFNQVGADYKFGVPLFRQMLRQTRDVGFLFEKAREELLTESSLA